MSQGNGDPSLRLFGPDVTPNLHALAQRVVLLDNFYDCGEVSGCGWPWSTRSVANEYVIKDVYNCSGRGRNYDFEGQDNVYLTGGFPATDLDGHPLSTVFPSGTPTGPRCPGVAQRAPLGSRAPRRPVVPQLRVLLLVRRHAGRRNDHAGQLRRQRRYPAARP
jgi:hypothetical protein